MLELHLLNMYRHQSFLIVTFHDDTEIGLPASEPQTTTEPPEPTGTPAASVGTETAAPTGSDSSSGTAAPGSDTSSDIRGGQPAVIIAVIAVAVIIAAAVIFAAVKSKKKKTGM